MCACVLVLRMFCGRILAVCLYACTCVLCRECLEFKALVIKPTYLKLCPRSTSEIMLLLMMIVIMSMMMLLLHVMILLLLVLLLMLVIIIMLAMLHSMIVAMVL